jgi:hypothetical protein
MIKSLLFIIMMIGGLSGFSQVFLLQEYFNDPVNLPSTWKTIDKDGDTYNWWINTSGTEIYAVSDSWRSGGIGPLTPENYLISPKIDLTGLSGTITLRFTIHVADPNYVEEHYKVAVSTTGNAAADFATSVFEETCTKADYCENYPYWHERIVDLTPFIGQQIYITWCHFDCTNFYNLALDSIQVSYTTDVNLPKPEPAKVNVYPNPAKEKLMVTGSFEAAQLQLFTSEGKKVFQSDDNTKQADINISRFESGVYFLKIKSQKGISTTMVNISH